MLDHDRWKAALPPPPDHGTLIFPKWVTGVTTAPRKQPTLESTITSLEQANLGPVHIFSEPGVPLLPEWYSTLRCARLGAWGNFILALHELFLRHPTAGCYLIVQDDVILSPCDLRSYLEGLSWPADIGMISLYCSSYYTKPSAGWYRFPGNWVWGAQALAFPRTAVPKILASAPILTHHFQYPDNRIDVALGAMMLAANMGVYYPTPSLVQHVGHTSTIWSAQSRCAGGRRADRFLGPDSGPR